jgi:hypothetical protein
VYLPFVTPLLLDTLLQTILCVAALCSTFTPVSAILGLACGAILIQSTASDRIALNVMKDRRLDQECCQCRPGFAAARNLAISAIVFALIGIAYNVPIAISAVRTVVMLRSLITSSVVGRNQAKPMFSNITPTTMKTW